MDERTADGVAVGAALAVCAAIGLAISIVTDGSFGYAIDDPYIHLAVAEQIAHGHYGVGPDAFDAPSSSPLWPFLLAPFARTPIGSAMPLLYDLLAVVAATLALRRLLAPAARSPTAVLGLTALGLLCTNTFGQIALGMENLVCQAAVLVALVGLERERPPWWTWLALGLAPLLRYESLGIVLPLLAWAAWRGERAAWATGVVIVTGLASFSAFLLALGLEPLPSSIVAKAGVGLAGRLALSVKQPFFFSVLFASCAALGVAVWKRDVLAGLAGLAGFAQCLFGIFLPISRYEGWAVGPLFVVLVRALYALPVSVLVRRVGTATLVAVFPYVVLIPVVVIGSRSMHDAHWQVRRLLDAWARPVAVNDLGFATWRRQEATLDLWGLGSHEALHARREATDGSWMDTMVQREDVDLAVLFESWFPDRPVGWVPVADLYYPGINHYRASDHFTFFATSPEAVEPVRQALEAWEPSLNERVQLRWRDR